MEFYRRCGEVGYVSIGKSSFDIDCIDQLTET